MTTKDDWSGYYATVNEIAATFFDAEGRPRQKDTDMTADEKGEVAETEREPT